MIGFNNGKYEVLENINIPITSLSINRGYGAFDFFQVINGKAFYLERHLLRLSNSLKELRISTEFESDIETIVAEVLKQNNLNNCYITIFVLPHKEGDLNNYKGSLYVFPSERTELEPELHKNGASLLLKNYQRDLPMAKSTSYLFGQFLRQEVEESAALDVLYYNGTTVQETSRGNIFVVKNSQVYTPSLNVLKGITRSIAIDILNENNYLFEEKEITIEELFAADEIFVTSTTKHIMPIVEIHKHIIGSGKPGEISLQIAKEFKKIKESYS